MLLRSSDHKVNVASPVEAIMIELSPRMGRRRGFVACLHTHHAACMEIAPSVPMPLARPATRQASSLNLLLMVKLADESPDDKL